jgi:hypothetical protein
VTNRILSENGDCFSFRHGVIVTACEGVTVSILNLSTARTVI